MEIYKSLALKLKWAVRPLECPERLCDPLPVESEVANVTEWALFGNISRDVAE